MTVSVIPELDPAFLAEVRDCVPPGWRVDGAFARRAFAYDPRVDLRRIIAVANENRMSMDKVIQGAHRWHAFGVVVLNDAPLPPPVTA